MEYYGPDRNFLGLDSHYRWEESEVAILPVPLEQTTSFMKGTALGPEALLAASRQVELFDDELHQETFRAGITTLTAMDFSGMAQEAALEAVGRNVHEIADELKKPLLLGGEHSLTIGAVRGLAGHFPGLHVLHLDAHADLRDTYENSAYNHACVMARVREICPFTSVGIRSLCVEESEAIQKGLLNVTNIHQMRLNPDWADKVLAGIEGPVYLTLDLDVFDPSVIPNVGTPEPGGMQWRETLGFLKRVFETQNVIGMDVVECCPGAGPDYGVFHAAKLVYRLIGYWLKQDSA